jgi:regulator of protease activity HflC (stomatin/prohibitin superfamily)
MKIVFIIIGLIVLAIAVFGVYRIVYIKQQYKRHNVERFERVKELHNKLESGQKITENDVLPFAKNVLTRQTVFQLLAEHDKQIFSQRNTII